MYVNSQRQKNEHMIPQSCILKNTIHGLEGEERVSTARTLSTVFGVFRMEPELQIQPNLFSRRIEKPFINAPWLLNAKKPMAVIKVKNKHDFLYQLSPRKKQAKYLKNNVGHQSQAHDSKKLQMFTHSTELHRGDSKSLVTVRYSCALTTGLF